MIDKSTLLFLEELHKNNDRQWFADNRSRYDAAKLRIIDTSAQINEQLHAFDSSIAYADPRRTIFRINRDTRFSPNKDPYKDHFGIALNAEGTTSSIGSSYYIHISPNGSFLAAGLFMPSSEYLKSVRNAIESDWENFEKILTAPTFKKTFGDLTRDNNLLKRPPRGFDPESAAIEYLKFKSFYVHCPLSDAVVTSPEFAAKAVKILSHATPLHTFLNRAISVQE